MRTPRQMREQSNNEAGHMKILNSILLFLFNLYKYNLFLVEIFFQLSE